MTDIDRAASWSRFWARGSAAASGDVSPDQQAGPVSVFWQDCLMAINPDHRVLDLGSGNGPLLRALLQQRISAGQAMPWVDAVDLAELNAAWLAQYPTEMAQRTHFHSAVRMEALPFEDARFDWVLSQYGFEYAEPLSAASELLRVMRPDGRVRMLLHHADSHLVAVAREELAHIRWLQGESGLLELARGMARPLAQAATPAGRAALAGDRAANQLRQGFNLAMQELETRAAASEVPDTLLETREALGEALSRAPAHGQAESLAAIAQLTQGLEDSALRLAELQSHALDEAGIGRLRELLGDAASRCVDAEPIHHAQGALMGWALRLDPLR